MRTKPLFLATALLLAASPRIPDEGNDFLVLELPHRVVLGDPIRLAVRGRPQNPYLVLADVGRKLTVFNQVFIHLDLGPALTVIGAGALGANGAAFHEVPTPRDPALENFTLYFQALGDDAAVVRRLSASDGKSCTLLRDDGQPLITLLTVNKISRDQNGAEIGEGGLWVPTTGFTIDLAFATRGRAPIDPSSLVVTCDKALGLGAVPPNTNLAQHFTFANGDSTASATVAPSWAFPQNTTVTLTATIKNTSAAAAPSESYTFKADVFRYYTQPFVTKQIWYLDFDRHDMDRTTVPDFREDLLLYGLGSSAVETAGPSFAVNAMARAEIQAQLRGFYGVGSAEAVNLDIVITRPASGVYATMCVGGRNSYPLSALPPGAKETTGSAYVNPNNTTKNLVCCDNNLGVHPRSIYYLFKDVPAFQGVFAPLQANPVGRDPDDPIVTQPGFDPLLGTARQKLRHAEIASGVKAFAKAVAFVLAQETGHAMGLVAPGPFANRGLLGGQFYGHSTEWHSDDGQGDFMSGNNSTPAPAEAPNLAMIWDHFQSGRAHFSALSWAYLRERVILQ